MQHQHPLPPELITQILTHLEPDWTSVCALHACSLVSRSFRHLAMDAMIWRAFGERWTQPGDYGDGYTRPYEYYKARHLADLEAVGRVNSLAQSSSGHLMDVEEILKGGTGLYDVLSALQVASTLTYPETYLSMQYWARQAWGAIERRAATATWKRIARAESDGEKYDWRDFENGLLAFCAFRGRDGAKGPLEAIEVPQLYDGLAADPILLEQLYAVQGSPNELIRGRTKVLTDHMQNNLRITSAQGLSFHALHNNFIDSVLNLALSDETPVTELGTLPMSLISIFCSLLNRLPSDLNLQARPVGMPGILLVAVSNRDAPYGTEKWNYVDIHAGGTFLSEAALRTRLRNAGFDTEDGMMPPATATDMIRRVAANITTSIHQAHGAHSRDGIHVALYAATMARFVVHSPGHDRQADWLVSLCQSEYPVDVGIIEKEVVPVLQGTRWADTVALCESIREMDRDDPEKKVRDEEIIRWDLGHVFVHRLFGYTAVIRGWDLKCEAPETWIQQMRVDTLPHGRNQPFYHVLVGDGSPRYVAQENVTTIPAPLAADCEVLESDAGIGKYFRKTERDESGRIRFVPSAELLAEYPQK